MEINWLLETALIILVIASITLGSLLTTLVHRHETTNAYDNIITHCFHHIKKLEQQILHTSNILCDHCKHRVDLRRTLDNEELHTLKRPK